MDQITAPKDWLSLGQTLEDDKDATPSKDTTDDNKPVDIQTNLPLSHMQSTTFLTYTYPQRKGGKGRPKGFKHSIETIQKIKNHWKNEEILKQFSERASKSLKGRPVSDATREKLRKARLGKTLSDETIKKLRTSQLKRRQKERLLKVAALSKNKDQEKSF